MTQPCEICARPTEMRCSDCAIDSGGHEQVALCGRTACEAAHERARNCRPCNPFVIYEARP